MDKSCNFCKLVYPATTDHFHKSSSGKFGLSGKCKSCYQKYRENNKEKLYIKNRRVRERRGSEIKEMKSKWREINKDHIRKKSKKYYEENKEQILDRQKLYIETNKRYVLMRSKAWRFENKERLTALREMNKDSRASQLKKWQQKNKDVVTMHSQIRRARKKILASDFTVEQWEFCKKEFEHKCAYCGNSEKLVQEHFIPLTRGGSYSANNIVPACASCNSRKHNNLFTEWYPTDKHFCLQRESYIRKYLSKFG